MPDRSPADCNPVGTHVLAGTGLISGALAQPEALGCEAIQVFVGNPRGWAHAVGKPGNADHALLTRLREQAG